MVIWLDLNTFTIDVTDSTAKIVRFKLLEFVIFPIIFGLLLSTIVALIPFKKLTYSGRYWKTFPFSIIGFLLFSLLSHGYLFYLRQYKGIDLGPIKSYGDINIDLSLDCSSVHNGSFSFENFVIHREGNNQIQIDKETGEKTEYQVQWVSNCEYWLIKSDSDTTMIKIVRIEQECYYCYSSKGGFAQSFKMNKLPDE